MAMTPRFFIRPEHNEWNFVGKSAAAYDGAIIPARYLSRYPEGSPSFEWPAVRLAEAVRQVDREVIVDPGTPALVSRSVVDSKAARLRATPAGQAIDLPLSLDSLADRGVRNHFVDATLEGQPFSDRKAAPYLDFTTIKGAAFQLNLQMIRRAMAISGPARTLVFVQVRFSRLLAGALAEAAPAIADTGATQVILRVRGFGEYSPPRELEAYLYALDAFLGAGLEVVIDCAGRLGPIFTHRGAAGFSSGSMFFRSVARDLFTLGGGGGGAALRYEVDGAWDWVERAQIQSDAACPVMGCEVGPGSSLDEIREHNLHLLRHMGVAAANWRTPELLASLRHSANPLAAAWASVLAQRGGSAAAGH